MKNQENKKSLSLIHNQLIKSKRVVIKVGSSLLVNPKGQISKKEMNSIVNLIVTMRKQKKEVILVSSGAVAAANFKKKKNINLELKQALASIGQVALMEYYRKSFLRKEIIIGQILFSKHSIKDRVAYLNARSTLRELLKLKALPIINENDSLATDEFKFGDNDVLGALTCGLVDADLYLILSNVNGFYDNHASENPAVIPLIENIDEGIYAKASVKVSALGTGGMFSKLKACGLTKEWGIPSFLTSGKSKNLYKNIFVKNQGTLFYSPEYKKVSSKKKWLWSNYDAQGDIFIDDGAKTALENNKSLLASGVIKVEGDFKVGDFCNLINHKKKLARGMVNFSFQELTKIKGKHSKEIEKILGYSSPQEVIHRDNLISF